MRSALLSRAATPKVSAAVTEEGVHLSQMSSASTAADLPSERAAREHTRAEGMLGEVWAARELLYFLAWRDVKVRYKQTALGVAWAIIQPLFTMAIFTVLFGRVANISSDGVPRPVFYFSALLPWLYISTNVSSAAMSMVSNSNLLTKIYFPRVMLPAAVALSGLMDFVVGSALLAGFMAYYRIPVTAAMLLWPILVLLMVALTLALGTFLAALNVKYRDVKYAVPFAIQVWMFITPVIYPADLVPAKYQTLLALNPAAGLVEAFRHTLTPNLPMRWDLLGVSALVTAILLTGALLFFRRTERSFADLI
jgi:lipopolysaccharide transport system permease protein